MSTSLIITVILLLLGVLAIADMTLRNSRNQSGGSSDDIAEPVTADEASPSVTGRFRVRQMLESTKSRTKEEGEKESQSPKGGTGEIKVVGDVRAGDDDELPDPF